MPDFDIILTSWNRLDFLRRTIGSLIQSGAYADCKRLIIVDNGSLDEGMDAFLTDLAHYQKTFVLRRPINDGWATAVNDAIGISRSPFVFLVNNDVEFDPDFHKEMLTTMGLISPEEASPVLLAGWRHTAHSVTVERENYDEMTDLPAVCWLLDKETMQKAGFLNEHGPCFTKGGNGEDSWYVNKMREHGPVGATKQDVARHLTGY